MTKTNCNKRPVFSCVWLAGIVLVGTAPADELPSVSTTASDSIVVNGGPHSKATADDATEVRPPRIVGSAPVCSKLVSSSTLQAASPRLSDRSQLSQSVEFLQHNLPAFSAGPRIETQNPFSKASHSVSDEAPTAEARTTKPSPRTQSTGTMAFRGRPNSTDGLGRPSNSPHLIATRLPKQDAETTADQQNGQKMPLQIDATASKKPLFRPLSAITLASAGRSESIQGVSLKQPDSHAKPLLASHGVWQDISGYRPTPFPRHNYFAIAHNPLYFEDPNLERLGRTDGCFTDVASAAKFFGRIPVLPYLIGSNEPHSCVPSLGNYSPGCSYGHHAYMPPLNTKGVALQTACTVSLIFLIP